MKKIVPLVALAAFLAVPAVASAKSGGVVLKVDRTSHLVAVAGAQAKVALVHSVAASRLRVGQRVALNTRSLRNGTFAAGKVSVVGRAHTVKFRGLLLKRGHGRTVVSAGGAVIALRSHARTTSSASDSGPQPGATVQVTATVSDDDELEIEKVQTVDPTAPGGQIEGRLTIGTGTITVADRHMALVLKVPTGFNLSTFKNGDEVLATFTQGADGSLTLAKLASDENADEADGDDGEHDGDNDDEHGDDGGGDDD